MTTKRISKTDHIVREIYLNAKYVAARLCLVALNMRNITTNMEVCIGIAVEITKELMNNFMFS